MVDFTAEFTTNHMGNLNVLLRMVERAAKAGASFIKMQIKDVESFYSQEKLDAAYDSPYGHTYREYRTIFEFGPEDFDRFDTKCREVGVPWFATAQDLPSLEFMLTWDLPLYKVASCNSRNHLLLQEIARQVPQDKTIVCSVAGSTLAQVEQMLRIFPHHKIFILHCVAEYPCKDTNLRLGNITRLKKEFEDDRVKIGYSGHEQGWVASIVAAHLGAHLIERHFCLSRHSFVHHIECSLEPEEFAHLVSTVKGGSCSVEGALHRLPPCALDESFGMSSMEEAFLIKHTYGDDFIKRDSHM